MKNTRIMLIFGLLLFTYVAFAQAPEPPPPNRGGTPPGAPIDGLVWFGGLVALSYGAIKKNINSKK